MFVTPPAPVASAPRHRSGASIDELDHAAHHALHSRVNSLTDDELESEAVRIAAAISAAQAELAAVLAEVERRGVHGQWECHSIERFAGWKCQIAPARASALGVLGRAMHELPTLGAAVVSGALSVDKAVSVARVAAPESEAALVDLALHATVEQTRRICSAWRRTAPQVGAELDPAADDAAAIALDGAATGRLIVIHDDDGVELRARFDHLEGALVLTALDAATAQVRAERLAAAPADPGPERRATATIAPTAAAASSRSADPGTASTPGPTRAVAATIDERPREQLDREQWRALGFLRMFEIAATHTPTSIQRSGFHSEVVVHVPVDALLDPTDVDGPASHGTRADPTEPSPRDSAGSAHPRDVRSLPIPTLEPRGIRLRRDQARLLVCDSGLHVVLEDATGDPLHLGRRTTSITPAQRRAVHARHQHCTWPGCTALVVQLHHRHHRVAGGHDDIENLVPLCSSHHGVVHRRSIVIGRSPDGTLRFVRADGTRISPTSPFHRHSADADRAGDGDFHGDVRLAADGAPDGAADVDEPMEPGASVEHLRERQRALGIDVDAPIRRPQWTNDRFDLGGCIDAVLQRRDAALRRTMPTGPPDPDDESTHVESPHRSGPGCEQP